MSILFALRCPVPSSSRLRLGRFLLVLLRAQSRLLVPPSSSARLLFRRHFANKREKGKSLESLELKRPTKLALDYFDEFFAPAIGSKWPSVRLALLSPNKYCAVANPFLEEQRKEELEEEMKKRGAVKIEKILFGKANLSSSSSVPAGLNRLQAETNSKTERVKGHHHLREENEKSVVSSSSSSSSSSLEENRFSINSYVPVSKIRSQEETCPEENYWENVKLRESSHIRIIEEGPISFPESWNVYTFSRGNLQDFASPIKDDRGLYNYYLMDGASLFPVWALGVGSEESVADLCAAPGGKALACLLTLKGKVFHLNDISSSRLKRLTSIFDSFVPPFYRRQISIRISNFDSRSFCGPSSLNGQLYDKILLDVPCSNDRLSCGEDENNWYHAKRYKERIELPEKQTQLLSGALKSLKKGGALVYSTCTLSLAQNDGPVHLALLKMLEETEMIFNVVDLRQTFQKLDPKMISLDFSPRYGFLILPTLYCNFGPMYICKIVRSQ